MLAVVVCGLTVFVVKDALGGHDEATTTIQVVTVRSSGRTTSRPNATETAPREVSRSRRTMPPATKTPPAFTPLNGLTISVDPGHNGGNFTHPEEIDRPVLAGASGTTKPCNTTGTETNDGSLTEAQFNWDMAQDLVPRLEELGATVVLTRRSNNGVGPCVNERAAIANHAHAAVALLIHADGNLTEGAHGFDVIHPSTAEMVAPTMAGPSLKLAEDIRSSLIDAGVPPANYVGEDGLDERSDLAGLNLAKRYLSTKMRHPSSEFSEQPPPGRAC